LKVVKFEGFKVEMLLRQHFNLFISTHLHTTFQLCNFTTFQRFQQMQPSNISTLQPSNEDTYLLVIKGKPEGPFSIDELKKLKIKPGDFPNCARCSASANPTLPRNILAALISGCWPLLSIGSWLPAFLSSWR
jgi:hypothetical protein